MDIKDKKLLRILVVVIIIFLVLNIAFLALRIINEFFLWIIITIAAVFAYKVLPKVKKK